MLISLNLRNRKSWAYYGRRAFGYRLAMTKAQAAQGYIALASDRRFYFGSN